MAEGAEGATNKHVLTPCMYVCVCCEVMMSLTMLVLLYTVHDMYLQRVHIWSLVLALRTT